MVDTPDPPTPTDQSGRQASRFVLLITAILMLAALAKIAGWW